MRVTTRSGHRSAPASRASRRRRGGGAIRALPQFARPPRDRTDVNDPLRVVDGIVTKLRIDGAASGPLAGTTFVAKDLFDVRGYRTGAGNPDWERTHEPATATAPAITRLLDAGATLVGKSCT